MEMELEEIGLFEDTPNTPGWLRDFVYNHYPQITFDAEGTELTQQWEGFVFSHPPHQESQLWCEKAANEASRGIHSVLLLPAVFNSIYWRQIVYSNALEVAILSCPIKKPGAKKQIVSQMALVRFGPKEQDYRGPSLIIIEPNNWQEHYYKRQRNRARFGIQN